MNELNQKPKRKRTGRNPYLFLGAGVAIGILIAGLVAVLFLFFAGTSTNVVSELGLPPTPTPLPFNPDNMPTVPPISAQGLPPTPIANRIQAAAISGNGAYLAYVSVEEAVSHIYLNELRVERNLTGNQYDLYQSAGYFNDVVFSPDGTKLIATIDSGFALLFDTQTRSLIEEYPQIGGAAFTHDSERLVLVGRNNGIRLLDVTEASPTLLAIRSNDNVASYMVGAVAVSADNRVAIALDDRIEIYEVDNLDAAPQIIAPGGGFVYDLAFHPTQSNRLAVALAGQNALDGFVQIYNLNNSSRSEYDFGTRVFAIAFSPDGQWLAVGGGETGYAESKLIAFHWDTSNNPIPADPSYFQPLSFEGHEHSILDVAFTREGYLLSTGWDGSVRLWDLIAPNSPISTYYP